MAITALRSENDSANPFTGIKLGHDGVKPFSHDSGRLLMAPGLLRRAIFIVPSELLKILTWFIVEFQTILNFYFRQAISLWWFKGKKKERETFGKLDTPDFHFRPGCANQHDFTQEILLLGNVSTKTQLLCATDTENCGRIQIWNLLGWS